MSGASGQAQSDSTCVGVSPVLALEASGSLPLIDLLRTPLSLLHGVDSRHHRRFMMFMRRRYALAGKLYRLGAVLGMAVILAPRDVGVTLAAPAGLLTLPSWFLSLMAFSTDMMAITTRQFEFWYFSVLNVGTWALLASFYSDFRAVSLVGACLGLQNVIFLDANFRTVVSVIKSSVVAVPALLLVALMAFFRLIDTNGSNFRVASVSHVSIELADLCANSAVTLAVFVARKTYNKRKLLVKRNHGLRIIRCVVFRVKLVMRPLQRGVPIAVASLSTYGQAANSIDSGRDPSFFGGLLPARNLDTSRFGTRTIDAEYNLRASSGSRDATALAMMRSPDTKQQLVLVPPKVQSVDVRRTLLCRSLSSAWWSAKANIAWRILLIGTGIASLVLTPIALLQHPEATTRTRQTTLAVAALVTTCTTCLPVFLSCQRDVLRALLRNFDFLFMSVQFIIAMAMLCDMTQWTARSLAVLAWLVWFQTVLMADAVTPPVRRALGLCKRHTVLPLALSVAAFVALAFALLSQDTALLTDRMLLTVSLGGEHNISMGTKSVLLNRLLTLVVWSMRLLWEAVWRSEAELMFLRGSMEYYTPLEMFPPVSEVAIAPLSILSAPVAHAACKFTRRITKIGSRRARPASVGSRK